MKFEHWRFTPVLFLIQLIRKLLDVEPITLTLGAATAPFLHIGVTADSINGMNVALNFEPDIIQRQ